MKKFENRGIIVASSRKVPPEETSTKQPTKWFDSCSFEYVEKILILHKKIFFAHLQKKDLPWTRRKITTFHYPRRWGVCWKFSNKFLSATLSSMIYVLLTTCDDIVWWSCKGWRKRNTQQQNVSKLETHETWRLCRDPSSPCHILSGDLLPKNQHNFNNKSIITNLTKITVGYLGKYDHETWIHTDEWYFIELNLNEFLLRWVVGLFP